MAAATEESNRIKATTTNTPGGTTTSASTKEAAYYVESTLDNIAIPANASDANIEGATDDNMANATICNIDDNIPLWKKELLQRRKTNLARTIGANQMTCSKKGKLFCFVFNFIMLYDPIHSLDVVYDCIIMI